MDRVMRDGYQISEEELIQIQNIQMELITEINRICEKHNIQYNMVGGTMLGAIRHQGHIPWDDDADIGFLRSEYEKFREVCKKELDCSKYYLQDIRDVDGYRWGYSKLRRKGTEFVRLNQEFMPYEQGVFVDLMPFDNVPDNAVVRKIHFVICFILRKLLWSEVGARNEERWMKRAIYSCLRHIPKKILVYIYEILIKVGERKSTELVRILTFPTPKKIYGYKREWYTDLEMYTFGYMKLLGAKDYDSYLSVKYGDYMILPPTEKRKIHPISSLKLLEEEV